MGRKLPCGEQHNLYIPNAYLRYFKKIVKYAKKNETSPSRVICHMMESFVKRKGL